MIEKLTREQEDQLIEYREYCLKMGMCTERADKDRSENAITQFYYMLGKQKPYFWWCQSILQAEIIMNLLSDYENNFGNSLRNNILNDILDHLRDGLRENLRGKLTDNFINKLGDDLAVNLEINLRIHTLENLRLDLKNKLRTDCGDNLRSNLGNNLRTNLMDDLESNLGDNLRTNLRTNLDDNPKWILRDRLNGHLRHNLLDDLANNKFEFKGTDIWGQMDYYWIAFYMFPEKYLGVKYDQNKSILLHYWEDIAETSCWWWAYENVVFISDRPEKLSVNSNHRLHSDGSPAIRFTDGYSLWALNDIRVSKEIAETPAEKLNPELILNEQNPDIQREIIRKIGAERVLKKLNAKSLDTWTDPKTGKNYELLHLKVNTIDRKYMYYEHASLPGYFYAKPVPPDINKAMHGRAWILSMVEISELSHIDPAKELEIEANLPSKLS
ncbi:MAG: hypothetical protein LHV68_04255 [Elusimicrobia bacterium]|nr:hypothetical protein [Candidatus Liberimonas magnetica]